MFEFVVYMCKIKRVSSLTKYVYTVYVMHALRVCHCRSKIDPCLTFMNTIATRQYNEFLLECNLNPFQVFI